jgi:hypothetical protein
LQGISFDRSSLLGRLRLALLQGRLLSASVAETSRVICFTALLWKGTGMNIYVGNLAFSATEEDLRQAFAKFGEVASVNIIMDRETGRSRGFAFVEMPDSAQANEAIEEVNGMEIAGRSVTVNEARPRSDRSRGGGGGGRRGRW